MNAKQLANHYAPLILAEIQKRTPGKDAKVKNRAKAPSQPQASPSTTHSVEISRIREAQARNFSETDGDTALTREDLEALQLLPF